MRAAPQIEAFLNGEPGGTQVDVSLSNGLIRSSKDMVKHEDNLFSVLHHIDDTETWFTRQGALEVLTGIRSPWDGDINTRRN